jgi:hypothetical protein
MTRLVMHVDLSAQIEDLWYEDYIAGLWIDGSNHFSDMAGECEDDDSPTVWLGHDVSAYFKTAGEKRVLLALIQGGSQGGGIVRIRIRFDSSKALEDDSNCGFLSSSCVKYAQGESGLCYVFEERWDCGTLHGIPVLARASTLDCAGPVRCMGEDCLDVTEEQSGDFAKAAAALQAAQMAASDTGLLERQLCRLLGRGHGV